MLNDCQVGSRDWPNSQKLFQAILFRAGSPMMAQQDQPERRASRFAAAAVEQDPHGAGAGPPFVEIVERGLNQLQLRHSSAGFYIVASEDDLPIGPSRPNFLGEPRSTALDAVGGTLDRDHYFKRVAGSLVSFDQIDNFGRFTDGEL
jgi:hypothetical protein